MESQASQRVNGSLLDPVLIIQADNFGVTTVTTLLKTINFCEKVNIFLSPVGIRFVVEEGKYVHAAILLKSELFRTFTLRGNALGFKIPFKELLDCLKLLGADGKVGGDSIDTTNVVSAGSSRSMKITYNGYGSPFCLALEEQGMLTEIELKTEEADQVMNFDEVQKLWDITMDSKLLHEYLFEVEGFNSACVTLRVVPETALELRATGDGGDLMICIPKTCTGLERFCTVAEPQQAKYKFNILRHSFKLIQAADKVILSLAEMDVLCLQLIFKDSMAAFAEFYLMAYLDDDSDMDME